MIQDILLLTISALSCLKTLQPVAVASKGTRWSSAVPSTFWTTTFKNVHGVDMLSSLDVRFICCESSIVADSLDCISFWLRCVKVLE